MKPEVVLNCRDDQIKLEEKCGELNNEKDNEEADEVELREWKIRETTDDDQEHCFNIVTKIIDGDVFGYSYLIGMKHDNNTNKNTDDEVDDGDDDDIPEKVLVVEVVGGC